MIEKAFWSAHGECALCAPNQRAGLCLKFFILPNGGVQASFCPGTELQGYRGLLQGGITAALLDSAMANALHAEGLEALTAELLVRYHHPVPIGQEICIRANRERCRLPLYKAQANLCNNVGLLLASASGKFLSAKD